MRPQYIVNNEGQQVAVVLSMEEYKTLLEQAEEVNDLQILQARKPQIEEALKNNDFVSFDEYDRNRATQD